MITLIFFKKTPRLLSAIFSSFLKSGILLCSHLHFKLFRTLWEDWLDASHPQICCRSGAVRFQVKEVSSLVPKETPWEDLVAVGMSMLWEGRLKKTLLSGSLATGFLSVSQ